MLKLIGTEDEICKFKVLLQCPIHNEDVEIKICPAYCEDIKCIDCFAKYYNFEIEYID